MVVRSLVSNQDSVTDTQEVISELQTVLTKLVDAETGQRGFLITGDERYLEPFDSGAQQIHESIDRVSQLTVDNPRQQKSIANLIRLVSDKLTELNETIQLRRNDGFEAAQTVVLTDAGKLTADEMRAVIGEMIAEEERLLTDRTDATASSSRIVYGVIIGGFAAATLITGVIAFFLSGAIASGIRRVSEAMKKIAIGDLSPRIDITSRDEVGQMSVAYGVMQSYLSEMAQAAEQIADGEFTGELRPRSEKDTLGNAFVKMVGTLRENLRELVVKLKASNDALRENEEQVRLLLNSAGEAIYGMDLQGNCTFCNPACLRLLGYDNVNDLLEQNMHDLTHHTRPDGSHYPKEECQNCQALWREEGTHIVDELLWRADGTGFPTEYWSYPVRRDDRIIGSVVTFVDISERKRVEEETKASLREKEVLLREIHHRVKNNLQVIGSLLNLQAQSIKDKRALEMFKESQGRVKTLALIHEKLSGSGDLARVDFADYIRSLVADLYRSYGVSSEAVIPKIDANGVSLDIDTAMPCGLIITELVSNSLKYAFPEGKKGEVLIDLHPGEDRTLTLIVGDNGVGFPNDLDFRSTDSLGLQLVCTLAEQLGGTVELDSSGGTEFAMTFAPTRSSSGTEE